MEPEALWVTQTQLKALSAGGRVPEWVPEARVLLLCPRPADRSRAGAPADPHQRGGCAAHGVLQLHGVQQLGWCPTAGMVSSRTRCPAG